MARVVLLNVVMFVLPFVIYGGYVYLVRQQAADDDDVWREAPFGWLVAAGFALLFLAIGMVISFSGGKPGQVYTPPTFEDGQIRPGRLE